MTREQLPEGLAKDTLAMAQISMDPKLVFVKFYGLNILGALLTLAICPQYGFGPFAWNVQIINSIIIAGPILCGIFCATVFFLGGNLLTALILTSIESKWIARKSSALIIPYISFVFMGGMYLRSVAPGHLHHDVFSYYASWLLTGILISIICLRLSSLNKTKIFLTS